MAQSGPPTAVVQQDIIEGIIGPRPSLQWSPDGKIIENITEYIASFCLQQEAMESPALVSQCKCQFISLNDEGSLTPRLAKVTTAGVRQQNWCRH
jgi:hypothetical protein